MEAMFAGVCFLGSGLGHCPRSTWKVLEGSRRKVYFEILLPRVWPKEMGRGRDRKKQKNILHALVHHCLWCSLTLLSLQACHSVCVCVDASKRNPIDNVIDKRLHPVRHNAREALAHEKV